MCVLAAKEVFEELNIEEKKVGLKIIESKQSKKRKEDKEDQWHRELTLVNIMNIPGNRITNKNEEFAAVLA